MIECPRCGNEAEYVAGECFALVYCDLCMDRIEVGDLDLLLAPSTGRDSPWRPADAA